MVRVGHLEQSRRGAIATPHGSTTQYDNANAIYPTPKL